MQWHIALTQPGQDRIAAAALTASYEVYHPLLPALVRLRRGLKRATVKSMFPGYLFVRDRISAGWVPLRRAQGVRIGSCLLTINGRLAAVDNATIDQVRSVEQDEVIKSLQTAKTKLPYGIGSMVKVTDGPLADLLGKVSALDDMGRVCVLMDILGRQTPVWLSASDLNVA